jgi:transcription antitermination factor NusG
MSAEVNSLPWFALHIRIYQNDSVKASLHNKGFEVFAPSYTARRVVAGHERQIPAPLFPGYMFCTLDAAEPLPVLKIPGVIRILGTGSALTVIPAEEIEAIRRTVASGLPLEPLTLLQPGEPVQVRRGPLAGIRGEVVYHKGKRRLVIRVSALNDRAVSIEVDQTSVARSAPAIFPSVGPAVEGFAAPVRCYEAVS